MRSTLVLDPGCSFADVARRLASVAWRTVAAAEQPLLPGEPEHAVLERAAGERIHYSFNPVCRLRVIEASGPLDADSLAQLPLAGSEAVASWLATSDERTLLRGVLAARVLSQVQHLSRVHALREHASGVVAQAAAAAEEALRASIVQASQQLAAATAELLAQQVRPLLLALAEDSDGSIVASVRPRPDDFARAFVPQVVDAARRAYDALWGQPPRVARAAPRSEVQCHVAPAGMLISDNALSRHFPGGYRRVAPLLDPHRVWAAWKVIPPGQDAGMSYDGLVWLDDHWAWFPKPYRVLAEHLAPPT